VSKALIVSNPDGSFEIYSDYDAGFVAALKETVPAEDREWDPSEKVWRVSEESHYSTIVSLAEDHYGVVQEQ